MSKRASQLRVPPFGAIVSTMKTISILLLLVALTSPASAFQPDQPELAGPLTVQVKGDKITATKPSGKLAWAIQHHSVNRDQRTKEIRYPMVGPVEFQGETFYAVRGDLLTLDTNAGRILARQQYPALISDLVVEGDKLLVELDIGHNSFGETTKVRTPYRSGFVAGRGPWESWAMVALRSYTDVPESLRDAEKFAKRKDFTAERVILRNAEARDPTNPMFPAYRGLAANADGDVDAANTAFAKAIVATGLWHEQLLICGVLERANRPGLAASTCAAAKETLEQAGLRPEAMLSLIAYVVAMKELSIAMEAAIARDDADAVHRIGSASYAIFPNVEAGALAYSALAKWFRERNDPRAEEWAQRADAALASPVMAGLGRRSREVDLWMLLIAAVFFALPFAGFGLGLRRDPDGEDGHPWLPRPRIPDGITLAALIVATIPLAVAMNTEVSTIGYLAEAPIATFHEGYGSPDVVAWLEQMPEGKHRDELFAFAKHELEAMKAGKRVTMDPPDPLTSVLAIEDLAAARGRDEALSLSMMVGTGGDVSLPNAAPLMLPGALIFFLFAVAGRITRKKMPKIADTATLVCPGASAGFLSPIVVTAMLAGALYLFTPVGTILQSIATPAFEKYFGIGALRADTFFPMDTTWAWVALGGALVVHVVTTVLARKRA